MELQSGALLPQLLKVIRKAIKHVKKCPLCCQKGFVCEICQSPSVIYPFQLDETHQVGAHVCMCMYVCIRVCLCVCMCIYVYV